MTTQNTYNPLIETALGSPVIPAAECINAWQVYETFDLLPGINNLLAPETSRQFTVLGATASIGYYEAGAELSLSALDPETLLYPLAQQPGLNKANASEWDPDADLIFDAVVKRFDTPDLLTVAGLTDTPTLDPPAINSGFTIFVNFDVSPNYLVGIITNGVIEVIETDVPIIPLKPTRFTILLTTQEGQPTGTRTARFFVDGQRVHEAIVSIPVPNTLRPAVGMRQGTVAQDATCVVYAIRAGRKF